MTDVITYRTTDNTRWGAGKGSDLDASEVDISLWVLWQAFQAVQAAVGAAAVGVQGFTVSGSEFYVQLTDGSTLGPYPLPVASLVSRGDWQPATNYNVNDIITDGGVAYIVIFAHTSAGSFDPSANDGSGHDYYSVFLDLTSYVTPQVNTVSGTSFVPARTDRSKYHRCTNSGAIAVTINANVFQAGDEIHFRQVSGVVTISAGTGVTINGVAGHTNSTSGQGAVVTLKCVNATTFDLFGMLGT